MTATADFLQHRPYLVRLAYRMLGTMSDAEDIVQQAFLRWMAAGEPSLESPRAWFTRTCTRLCLDRLKSARHQREEYVGEWLPEPIVDREDPAPEVDETLSMALLVTVQRLRPAERAAFLLHDIFDYDFKEVAEILDLKPAHCRKLAARARRRLDGESLRSEADSETVQRLSEAFFQALESGDLQGLQAMLSEDVKLHTDGGGRVAAARRPLVGPRQVLRFLHGVFIRPDPKPPVHRQDRWFNGAPGALLLEDGKLASAVHFRIAEGLIQEIFVQRNPDKLGPFDASRREAPATPPADPGPSPG